MSSSLVFMYTFTVFFFYLLKTKHIPGHTAPSRYRMSKLVLRHPKREGEDGRQSHHILPVGNCIEQAYTLMLIWY